MCKQGSVKEVKLCKESAARKALGIKVGMAGVDTCIADIVQALNTAGIYTIASCCGHGETDGSIILEDSRELVIKTHFDQISTPIEEV